MSWALVGTAFALTGLILGVIALAVVVAKGMHPSVRAMGWALLSVFFCVYALLLLRWG